MLNVGVIGTGGMARDHARAIASLPGEATLVAAADLVEDRLRAFCDTFPVPRSYRDADELINDPTVELVTISTPPSTHESLVVAALEAGKYVFCEKPLAPSLASAARIVAAEARYPGRLAIDYTLRYDPELRRLRWLCENNWIGRIQTAVIERHESTAAEDATKQWWGQWAIAGGGVLITQLIHELDFLSLLMGKPISIKAAMDRRFSEIESEDYLEARIQFEGGRTARCCASVNSGHLGGEFRVAGTDGQLAWPFRMTTTDSKRAVRALGAVNRAVPMPSVSSRSAIGRSVRALSRRFGAVVEVDLGPLAYFYRDLAHALKAAAPLPVSAKEAWTSLELCMAAYESALTGDEVRLPMSAGSAVFNGITKEMFDQRRYLRLPPESENGSTTRRHVC